MDNKIVTYTTYREGQAVVIVTTTYDELETLDLYFTQGGRCLEDYDREEYLGSMEIRARFNIFVA